MVTGAISLVLAMAAPSLSTGGMPPSAEQVAAYHPAQGDEKNFWRYFFFWRGGIGPEAARADFLECSGYAQDPVLYAHIPDRMPLEGGVRGPSGTEGAFGPSGAVIFAMVEGSLVQRVVLANMRRCMGFKGYYRYGLSAALWRPLNDGTPEQVVERLTAIAAGPEPRQARLAP